MNNAIKEFRIRAEILRVVFCPKGLKLKRNRLGKLCLALLNESGMGPEHLVKVSQYLVRPEDIARYSPIRAKWPGDNRPASMLVVPGLVRPHFPIEIEAYAATN